MKTNHTWVQKIATVFLSAVLMLSCCAATASALEPTSGTCGTNLTWTLSGQVLMISGSGEMDDYTWQPGDETTDGTSPFAALDYAILVVEEGVQTIGDSAFSELIGGTPKLQYLSLPSSLKRIGEKAFFGCAGLMRVTIPENVEEIGDGAFAFCTGLTGFIVDSGNSLFFSRDGLLFEYDELIQCPAGYPGTEVSLSDVDRIRAYAFSGCHDLSSIDIPYTVNMIGKAAFEDCSALRYVQIPKGVAQIPEDTFSGCTALARVDISKCLEAVGARAFSGCAQLKDVYYSGTRAQWDALPIGAENDALRSAQIHCDRCVVTLAVEQPEGYAINVTGDGIYTVGDTVTITAVPVPHIRFDNWRIDGEWEYPSTEYSFTADDHILVSAFFSESFRSDTGEIEFVTVRVLVESDNGSTASAGGDYHPHPHPDEEVTLTAHASEKEVFAGWYEGDTLLSTDPIYKFSAEKSITVRAVFVRETLKDIQVIENVELHPRNVFLLEPETEYGDPQSLRFIFKSSDTRTAQVDQNGKVTAHKPGTAKITVIAIDEYGNIASDVCTVRVRYCWYQWLIAVFLFGWIWY